jgi:hypothetical protein
VRECGLDSLAEDMKQWQDFAITIRAMNLLEYKTYEFINQLSDYQSLKNYSAVGN